MMMIMMLVVGAVVVMGGVEVVLVGSIGEKGDAERY